MEKIQNRKYIRPLKLDDTETMYKKPKKIAGFKSLSNFDCLVLKKPTVTFETPMYIGFFVPEFPEFRKSKTAENKINTNLEGLKATYMCCSSFFIGFKTSDIIKDISNFSEHFLFRNVDE